MMHEKIIMEHCRIDTDKATPLYSKRNLFRCHNVHQKPHVELFGIEIRPPQWEFGDQTPDPRHCPLSDSSWNFWIIGSKLPTCGYDPCDTPREWHLILELRRAVSQKVKTGLSNYNISLRQFLLVNITKFHSAAKSLNVNKLFSAISFRELSVSLLHVNMPIWDLRFLKQWILTPCGLLSLECRCQRLRWIYYHNLGSCIMHTKTFFSLETLISNGMHSATSHTTECDAK